MKTDKALKTQLMETIGRDLNEVEGLFSYVPTWMSHTFFYLPHKIIAFFAGNQSAKTALMNYQTVMRIYGLHPVPKKNVMYFECEKRNLDNIAPHGYYKIFDGMTGDYKGWEKGTWNKMHVPISGLCPYCGSKIRIHKRKSLVFRLASEISPSDRNSFGTGDNKTIAEVRSTMYPEFKKWLPDYLIARDKFGKKLDISTRSSTTILNNPNAGRTFCKDIVYNGQNIVIEYVSYTQSVQSSAGKQRLNILLDEESPEDFWEEQYPGRLVAEDGDIMIGVTPAIHVSWTFDLLHEKAKMVCASDAYVEFAKKNIRRSIKNYEYNDSNTDIAVIKSATDDNPILSREAVDDMYRDVSDPETLATRRYGIHRQSTGRIFKDFSDRHIIHPQEYFNGNGWEPFFEKCNLARTYDHHTHKPHAILWLALSFQNELFVWNEFLPSTDKWVTKTICAEIAKMSKMYRYKVNTIDPNANAINLNTGKTTMQEMNEHFRDLRREGVCMGGVWETFNTKGDYGRNAIKQRLAGSIKVGKPFNNTVVQDGVKVQIPTLWVFDNCHEAARSLKHWRLEETKNVRHGSRDEKTLKPAQRFSHCCTALEGALKDSRFVPVSNTPSKENEYKFFNNRMSR